MKKFMLVLMVALVGGISKSVAQSKLVATLTHGDDIRMFYGANALSQAHYAAQSGDVITLSGGEFTGITITKSVILRGTGFDATEPTIVQGTTLNITSSDTNHFSVEGIRFSSLSLSGSCVEPLFLKCYLGSVSTEEACHIKDALFVNCRVFFSMKQGYMSAKFSHCDISNFNIVSNLQLKVQFINSVVSGYSLSYFRNSSFINSILICSNSSSDALPAETVAMNCVVLTKSSYYTVFSKMQGSEISCYVLPYDNILQFFSNSGNRELSDEAKTTYLGTDGTEVGLYGGKYPYTTTPAYPRITKLNVSKQTTPDGKLSVDIEVSAAE